MMGSGPTKEMLQQRIEELEGKTREELRAELTPAVAAELKTELADGVKAELKTELAAATAPAEPKVEEPKNPDCFGNRKSERKCRVCPVHVACKKETK
jgi:hypothetical protein